MQTNLDERIQIDKDKDNNNNKQVKYLYLFELGERQKHGKQLIQAIRLFKQNILIKKEQSIKQQNNKIQQQQVDKQQQYRSYFWQLMWYLLKLLKENPFKPALYDVQIILIQILNHTKQQKTINKHNQKYEQQQQIDINISQSHIRGSKSNNNNIKNNERTNKKDISNQCQQQLQLNSNKNNNQNYQQYPTHNNNKQQQVNSKIIMTKQIIHNNTIIINKQHQQQQQQQQQTTNKINISNQQSNALNNAQRALRHIPHIDIKLKKELIYEINTVQNLLCLYTMINLYTYINTLHSIMYQQLINQQLLYHMASKFYQIHYQQQHHLFINKYQHQQYHNKQQQHKNQSSHIIINNNNKQQQTLQLKSQLSLQQQYEAQNKRTITQHIAYKLQTQAYYRHCNKKTQKHNSINIVKILNSLVKLVIKHPKTHQLDITYFIHTLHTLAYKRKHFLIANIINTKCFYCNTQRFMSSCVHQVRIYQKIVKKLNNILYQQVSF